MYSYDIDELKRQADLKELYEKITGMKLRKHSNHWTGSCPQCEGDDRFYIRPEDNPQTWVCTHCHPNKGTAVDLVALCYHLPTSGKGLNETVAKLAELLNVPESSCAKHNSNHSNSYKFIPKPKKTMPDTPSQEWQTAVREQILFAQDCLWSKPYRRELDYLRNRGFTDDTLRGYSIGFMPTYKKLSVTSDDGRAVGTTTGIYIPTYIRMYEDDLLPELTRVKVRIEDHVYQGMLQAWRNGKRDNKPDKYISITGSKGVTLFCAEYALTYPNIIYVEGEFDAMTINQAAGDICRAVTFGSNNGVGSAELWQSWYRMPERTIICYDNDRDESTRKIVRENEKRLLNEITKAQSYDDPDLRADPPIIRHLPEEYHDWNDILIKYGVQTIRDILTDFFGDHPDDIRDMG